MLPLLLIALLSGLCANAQNKPHWAIKGVGEINKKRSNDSYTFVKFENFAGSMEEVRRDAQRNLPEYLSKIYGTPASDFTVTVDDSNSRELDYKGTMANQAEGNPKVQTDYYITDGARNINARLVDEYISYDENTDGTYDFTLYQLFAVQSNPDVAVHYDIFEYSRAYNGQAVVRSIIPGLGQLYKGQNAKAYTIWGAEALFVGTAIYFDCRSHNYFNDAHNSSYASPDKTDFGEKASYLSKARSWRNLRNISIALAIGTYAYNLIDAACAKGPRKVIVKKANPSATEVAMSPAVVYDPLTGFAPGAGLRVTF